MDSVRPKVVVSRCLEFDNCRYNGQKISSEIIEELTPHVDFIKVCPEVEIGLGVPRDPIRIISKGGKKKLIQPKTGNEYTDSMKKFCEEFLSSLSKVDGFLLKNRSPSCGFLDVKIYPEKENSAPIGRGSGFFGGDVLEMFPNKVIEDEGRIRNYVIRDNFLTKLFILARFRNCGDTGSIKNFHEYNRLLLKSYNNRLFEELEEIIKKDLEESSFENYERILNKILSKSYICESKIDILEDLLEDISNDITEDESDLFLKSLDDYRKGRTSFQVPLNIMKSWMIRLGKTDMKNQTFFEPYPSDLLTLETVKTCQARDFWEWKDW